MNLSPYDNDQYADIRASARKLCAEFPGDYWRKLDEVRAYPTEFVRALTKAGYLSALIPEQYGGSRLGISAAAAVLENIQAEGCNERPPCQMYTMGTIPARQGRAKQRVCRIAAGELRLQAFGVTEPTAARTRPCAPRPPRGGDFVAARRSDEPPSTGPDASPRQNNAV
jgi:alkylation response protein AidB-like acyl-CoA dehydrogenase